MKTLVTKLSSSFLLFYLFALTAAWAKPVAQVIEVSGTVFMISPEGKTSQLKINQHLDDKSEVMVEEGAFISLNDYYDSTYHLAGGSHLKFFNKSVQLKKGKAWIKSQNTRHPLAVTTANSYVGFWKGEFITTFDQATSKTQVLVVNGDVEVSNILDKNMKSVIHSGSFTTVDTEIENGAPRAPTKVGLASLNSALAEFKKLPSNLEAEPAPTRSIASVVEPKIPMKKGEIVFMKAGRLPASIGSGTGLSYYKNAVKSKSQFSPVVIKAYGVSWNEGKTYSTVRKPASVPSPIGVMPRNVVPAIKNDHQFAESLKTHTLQQPKHPKELENLIKDLNSY